ncbi:MAG TPA: FAD-dependent oxidoreductase [Candidatus Dormibacteraeota bacterium]|nr:FAD-dependent oxidoreductase [Candidatus Dormibacteraeota bacterium]
MAPNPVFSDAQRATLRVLCDTFVPAIEHDPDPGGFWARPASDLQVADWVEATLGALPADVLDPVREFMDGLAMLGFPEASPEDRERFIHAFMDASPEALGGIVTFRALTLMMYIGMPDASGKNPAWESLGYPGPLQPAPATPKVIRPLDPTGDDWTLEADAVVIGSGAGGGVVAARLAEAGKDVVIVEGGGYFNEADFNQYELWAYQNLYRNGGLAGTADGSVTLMTGANLGGGTTVNWTNCIKTRPAVRAEWARLGLDGVDGAGFDRHLDSIWKRLGVNDQCSDLNNPHKRLQEACQKLGYSFSRVTRNADPANYDPQSAGFMGFGDQSGSKMGTMKTYLEDAYEHGARFVVRCRADRITTENGRATGVEATYNDGTRQARVRIKAPTVVVACGALDSPALLLRSGIGGQAVGQYLRLHPATAVVGVYDEPQQAWWGAPQTALSDQFSDLEEGYGFLIECNHASPALGASALPWASGRQAKEFMAEQPYQSPIVFLIRDRGHGRVTIDARGETVVDYHLDDTMDERHFRRGLKELVKIHHAAGARGMFSLHTRLKRWDRGSGVSIEAFAQDVHDGPLTPYEHATFSLHHMGSCRLGADPQTSVANPWGELHDTRGVWIGDGSGFPTASGTNPMISIMALASRTAEAINAG